jgi:hypothetical protein
LNALVNAVLSAPRGGPTQRSIPDAQRPQQRAGCGDIAPLRQGNGAWGKQLLGYSERSTIGSEGCTITCLAMLLGTTPDVVNERLRAVSGFEAQRVVWDRIGDAFPGVTARHVPSLDISEVETCVPCLVEVDGAPIGAVRHWVVYLGNGRILDPWFGAEGSLSRYRPLSYSVVSGIVSGD